MTHEQADSALADAIWWFKGFRAAHADNDPTCGMADDLRNARNWLSRLARGKTRLLGLTERAQGVVLTEYEFEVVFDALRDGSCEQDRNLARPLIQNILDEIRAERDAARAEEKALF